MFKFITKKSTANIQCNITNLAICACNFKNSYLLFSSNCKNGANILGINPVVTINTNSIVLSQKKMPIENPFDAIEKIIKTNKKSLSMFLGYISYDYKEFINPYLASSTKTKKSTSDLLNFSLFEHYIITKNNSEKSTIITAVFPFEYKKIPIDTIWESMQEKTHLSQNKKSQLSAVFPNKKNHIANVKKSIDEISRGDYYQINLTRKFSGVTELSHKEALLKLIDSNNSEFGIYFNSKGTSVVSTSPERFFKISASGKILTTPIKGTISANIKNGEQILKNDVKETAELAMITDLLRNDISTICVPGSVVVEKFPSIKKLKNVLHLYSKIVGRLNKKLSLNDIFAALFPGGSITGCPKVKACKSIEEIENYSRGIYTGSAGYIKFNRSCDFNILIRTVVLKGKKFFFNTGGGITVLSEPQKEYEETILKAENIRQSFNINSLWGK